MHREKSDKFSIKEAKQQRERAGWHKMSDDNIKNIISRRKQKFVCTFKYSSWRRMKKSRRSKSTTTSAAAPAHCDSFISSRILSSLSSSFLYNLLALCVCTARKWAPPVYIASSWKYHTHFENSESSSKNSKTIDRIYTYAHAHTHARTHL